MAEIQSKSIEIRYLQTNLQEAPYNARRATRASYEPGCRAVRAKSRSAETLGP